MMRLRLHLHRSLHRPAHLLFGVTERRGWPDIAAVGLSGWVLWAGQRPAPAPPRAHLLVDF